MAGEVTSITVVEQTLYQLTIEEDDSTVVTVTIPDEIATIEISHYQVNVTMENLGTGVGTFKIKSVDNFFFRSVQDDDKTIDVAEANYGSEIKIKLPDAGISTPDDFQINTDSDDTANIKLVGSTVDLSKAKLITDLDVNSQDLDSVNLITASSGVFTTADINAGTIDNTTIGATTPSTIVTTDLTATTVDIEAGTIDNTVIGATTPSTIVTTNLTATTADINAGTFDGVVGGTTPAAGTFTTATATTGNITTVNSTDVNSTNLDVDTGTIDTLTSTTAGIGTVNATDVNSTNLDVDTGTIDTFTSTTAGIGTVNATTGNITTVNSTDVNVSDDLAVTDDASIGGDLAVTGNTILTGNLTVNGTQTIVNTETMTVDDNIIVLNNNEAGTPSANAGIEIERGTSDNALVQWNETTDKWEAKVGSSYADLKVEDVNTNTLTATTGTVTNLTATTADINAGTIDNTTIGATTPSTIVTTDLTATTADINAGTIDNTTIGATTPSTIVTTNLTATTADINAGTIDATTIGATTPSTIVTTDLTATTADINAGSIDGTIIGATTSAAGTFTTMTADTVDINGGSIDGVALAGLTNISVSDAFITINDDVTEAASEDMGITFNRGNELDGDAVLKWNETSDRFEIRLEGGTEPTTNASLSAGLTYLDRLICAGDISTSTLTNIERIAIDVNDKETSSGDGIVLFSSDVSDNDVTTSNSSEALYPTGTAPYNTGGDSPIVYITNESIEMHVDAVRAGNHGTTILKPDFLKLVKDGAGVDTITTIRSDSSSFAGNITVSGDILPEADNTRSLGSATKQWHSVHVGPGSLYIDGHKVLGSDAVGEINITTDDTQDLWVVAGGPAGTSSTTGELYLESRGGHTHIRDAQITLGTSSANVDVSGDLDVNGDLEAASADIGSININGSTISDADGSLTLTTDTSSGYIHANTADMYVGSFTDSIKIDNESITRYKPDNGDLNLTSNGTGVIKIDDIEIDGASFTAGDVTVNDLSVRATGTINNETQHWPYYETFNEYYHLPLAEIPAALGGNSPAVTGQSYDVTTAYLVRDANNNVDSSDVMTLTHQYDMDLSGNSGNELSSSMKFDVADELGEHPVADVFGQTKDATYGGSDRKTVEGVALTDPCQITSTGHGLSDDDIIRISQVNGTTELNDRLFKVSNTATDTFELKEKHPTPGWGWQDCDATGYSTYTDDDEGLIKNSYVDEFTGEIILKTWNKTGPAINNNPTGNLDQHEVLTASSDKVEVKSPFQFASYTTTERDALSVSNGTTIYNETTDKFQGYAGGSWVDLH